MDLALSLEPGLRLAVIDLRRRSGKRRLAPALHAGSPGGPSVTVAAGVTDLDHALRIEIAGTLIGNAGRMCQLVWLTRAGLPSWHDHDAAWASPVLTALREAVADDVFVVVTPHGWYAPLTGQGRQWLRPREHS